ncbi:SsrA-binding protein [Ascidiimonas aurantiaca]|uniref:SsrA-binding protein n=1 Tax=Ascidiimonas aurantiaca TaxID=1685432 RepID=UPI0030EB456A
MGTIKKRVFKFLARINKQVLPSYSKKRLDLTQATKFQMLVIAWKWYVTRNTLD